MALSARAAVVVAAIACVTCSVWADLPRVWPPPDGKDVPPDAPLRVTLTDPAMAISLGTGKIEVHDASTDAVVAAVDVGQGTRMQAIGGLPNYVVRNVILEGPRATIPLPPHALAYGKTYYVTCPGTAFPAAGLDAGGIAGNMMWRFTTNIVRQDCWHWPSIVGTENRRVLWA